jgi:hypothetical protein
MYLGHDLSALVFYYSLQFNVSDFNATEIFLLAPKGLGGGGGEEAA